LRAVCGQQVPQNDLSVEKVASVKTAASEEAVASVEFVEAVASVEAATASAKAVNLLKYAFFHQYSSLLTCGRHLYIVPSGGTNQTII
jgi:hypothetical protein